MSLSQPINHDPDLSLPSLKFQRGAYAVIRDEAGRVLIVEAESGRCYLPGGRIEPGESPQTALVREISEECGWFAAVEGAITEALQTILDGDVRLEATYWYAILIEQLDVEPELALRWVALDEAAARLHRAGDRLALDMAG